MAEQTLFSFLEGLKPAELEELYTNHWAALAVVQSLSPLGRLIIMRLLLPESPVTQGVVVDWFQADEDTQSQVFSQLDHLLRLKLVKRSKKEVKAVGTDGQLQLAKAYVLSRNVRGALKLHRSCPSSTPFQSHSVEESVTTTVIGMAEEHARSTWEAMLAYLVGADAVEAPRPQVITVLVTTGLLAPGQPDTTSQGYGRLISTKGPAGAASDAAEAAAAPSEHRDSLAAARLGTLQEIMKSRTVHMTQKGYSFLLSDLQVQLWTFVAEYVRSATQASAAVTSAAVLAFLFQMGFCTAGSVYSTDSLDGTQRVILQDLAAFGLVFVTGDGGSFTPTSLAMRLVAGRATAAAAVQGQQSSDLTLSAAHMTVVAERNMRVYVYTSSPLAVDLLRVFLKVDAVMPNLVSGTLTKASVGAALDMGLTAAEIVHFLQCRLHPRMLQEGLRVPDNVADALHAWEAERHRAPIKQAALLENFDDNAEFEDVMRFLQPEDVLFAPSAGELEDAPPYVVVRLHAVQQLKPFLEERRRRLG